MVILFIVILIEKMGLIIKRCERCIMLSRRIALYMDDKRDEECLNQLLSQSHKENAGLFSMKTR